MKRFTATIVAMWFLTSALPASNGVAPTDVPQIPLCMIGDSITWAGDGDYWRQYLLEQLPALAFVGTHTAKLGYSHAGEGGNRTQVVLLRLGDLPDCPHYSLLIGTNDNNIKDETAIGQHAAATADRIVAIVQELLKKPSARKVFLCSILPCQTDNPLRDRTNAATNGVLRQKMATLPKGQVVWVELEKTIRAIENWGPMIKLHPTQEGYKVLAKLLAGAIATELGVKDRVAVPRPRPGGGVRVENLWEGGSTGRTSRPVIAGWYSASFDVVRVAGPKAAVTIRGELPPPKDPKTKQRLFNQSFPVAAKDAGKRVTFNFFTEYEGYKYTRSPLVMTTAGCEIANILIEKQRPSGKASAYGQGSYVDTATPPQPGELVERP
ncbi:MAG: GDSL-type esterase/lipase family protein [Verrucomicrobia bacterium]|nr:GDSL-type esterase/lipase family protein [Verrucomicrobiota bacterium]